MKTVEERIDKLEELVEKLVIEMLAFKEEMKIFKEEMREFKKQSEKDRREFNKQLAEISKKVGKITEDLVRPAARPVIEKYFGCEVSAISSNLRMKDNGLNGEFDVVAISKPCKKIFLIEVKSTPRIKYVDEFLEDLIPRFKHLFNKYFSEYQDYKLIPIFASLEIPEDILNYLSKQNIYAMAYREWDYMDILNFNKVKI